MSYTIELASRAMAPNSTPVNGRWYAGITKQGETGAVAQYVNGEFINAAGSPDMTGYQYLRALDNQATEQDRKQTILLALRHLETLINSRVVLWNPEQKLAAQTALDAARASV